MDNVLELEKLKSVCGSFLNNVNLDKVKAELTEVFNPKGSLDAINLMRFMLGDNTSLLTSLNNLYVTKLHTWSCYAYGETKDAKFITISDKELSFSLNLLEDAVIFAVTSNGVKSVKDCKVLYDSAIKSDDLPTEFEKGGNIKGCFDNLKDKYFLQHFEQIDLSISTFTSGSNVLYPNGKTFVKVNITHDGCKYESVFELPFNLTKESMWRLIKDNLKVVGYLTIKGISNPRLGKFI